MIKCYYKKTEKEGIYSIKLCEIKICFNDDGFLFSGELLKHDKGCLSEDIMDYIFYTIKNSIDNNELPIIQMIEDPYQKFLEKNNKESKGVWNDKRSAKNNISWI